MMGARSVLVIELFNEEGKICKVNFSVTIQVGHAKVSGERVEAEV